MPATCLIFSCHAQCHARNPTHTKTCCTLPAFFCQYHTNTPNTLSPFNCRNLCSCTQALSFDAGHSAPLGCLHAACVLRPQSCSHPCDALSPPPTTTHLILKPHQHHLVGAVCTCSAIYVIHTATKRRSVRTVRRPVPSSAPWCCCPGWPAGRGAAAVHLAARTAEDFESLTLQVCSWRCALACMVYAA